MLFGKHFISYAEMHFDKAILPFLLSIFRLIPISVLSYNLGHNIVTCLIFLLLTNTMD